MQLPAEGEPDGHDQPGGPVPGVSGGQKWTAGVPQLLQSNGRQGEAQAALWVSVRTGPVGGARRRVRHPFPRALVS